MSSDDDRSSRGWKTHGGNLYEQGRSHLRTEERGAGGPSDQLQSDTYAQRRAGRGGGGGPSHQL